jgi:hypothetical protein
LWEGTVLFGRNRESRSREAAGAQELARSSAQENQRQKRWMYRESLTEQACRSTVQMSGTLALFEAAHVFVTRSTYKHCF